MNLRYVVLDCDEHDGKLRRDLEHKETDEGDLFANNLSGTFTERWCNIKATKAEFTLSHGLRPSSS